MRKLHFLLLFLLIILLFLPACGQKGPLDSLSQKLGMDLSGAELLQNSDSHGGFHGDGEALTIMHLPLNEMPAGWSPLPLPTALHQAVHGDSSHQPLLDGIPAFETGYYWFYDRHDNSTDSRDPKDLWNRSSFNFSLALYDSQSETLYYAEFDT